MKRTPIQISEHASDIVKALPAGVLLTSAANGTTNAMTIAWGFLGVDWAAPVFVSLVRLGRYSHELIDASKQFTVCLPWGPTDNKAIGYCGARTGRGTNKIADAGLTPVAGEKVQSPAIREFPLTLECQVVYQQDQDLLALPEDMRAKWYPANVPSTSCGGNRDTHTAFYGKIVDAYVLED